MSIDKVLETFKTSKDGLSDEEAIRRIEKFGPNELVEEKKAGPVKIFLLQFADILIALLIVAAIAAYFIGDTLDAIVILIVVVINAIIGFMQEYRAEKAMEKLKGLVSNEAVVKRDGQVSKIPASQLALGDIVIVEEGDKVPADIRLIETADLRIDESSLTGESLPVTKVADEEKAVEKKDLVAYMDSAVVKGRGIGVVEHTGMDTNIGKIAQMIQEVDDKTPLQVKIAKLGKFLGLTAVVICVAVFFLRFFQGHEIVDTFMTAVSLAVAAVPEGLPAILTLTLALGMQRMAKSNAVVRKLLAVETLGSCNVICTDKTGTLTLNEMTVRDARLTSTEKALEVCALCNNATIKEGKVIGDPTDGSVMKYAQDEGYYPETLEKLYPRLEEIPLDSTRKRMTTIHENKELKEVFLLSKGAPEIIIEKCSFIEQEGKVKDLSDIVREDLLSQLNEMTSSALRVLALAYRTLDDTESADDGEALEKDLIFVGLVGMMDPPRKEAADAIKTCHKAGIKVVMITGDHQDTAAAIAREIGILDNGRVLTGDDLDELTDHEFTSMVNEVEVYARVFPEQKVKIVKALQDKGNVVSMTGDGVNDAPALKKASIGVSMGSGTDVAKESADMVLQDDNFATIVSAVKEGRMIFDNIRRFVKFQLSTNVGAILTIVAASLMNFAVFTPIQILWINIIMDGPPAQSLGVEAPETNIMDRGPENNDILTRNDIIKVLIAGVVMAIGTIGLYLYEISIGAPVIKAMTMAFTLFVVFQIFNAFNRKNPDDFSNKVFIIAIVASLILQFLVIYLPYLQGIFKTTALGLMDWVIIIVVGLLIFVSDMISEKII